MVNDKEIEQSFREYKESPFPGFPEDLDSYAEFVLADSYIAGAVSSYLSGVNINFKPEDLSDIKKEIKNYNCKNDDEKK